MNVQPTPQLAELLAAYRDADATAKAATQRADEVKEQLKVAMLDAAQAVDPTADLKDTELTVGDVRAALKWTEAWRLDTTKLKAEQPEVYAAYAKKSGSLRLTVGLN